MCHSSLAPGREMLGFAISTRRGPYGGIGVLIGLAATDADGQARVGAFLQGLQEFGWAVGRNVRIDTRWAAGSDADTRQYAAELVALAPDVIVASGGSTVGQVLAATRTVPIVFAIVPDPVGAGFVDNLAIPHSQDMDWN